MEDSILKSVKKTLGLHDEYDDFDIDVVTHINTVFLTLNQLGIGPEEGYMIEDDGDEWVDFLGDDDYNLNAVRSYVYLRVRLLFDPPEAPHHITAIKEQITELEYRLRLHGEERRLWQPVVSPLI